MIVDCILTFRYPVKLLRKEEGSSCVNLNIVIVSYGILVLDCVVYDCDVCICGQLRFVVKIVKFFILILFIIFIFLSLPVSGE